MEKLQDPTWLKQKYIDEQLSMTQIGQLLGCSRYPVYRALKKFGIDARAHTSKYSQLNDKEWLLEQHNEKGKSIRQIADEIGATAGAVQSALAHTSPQVSQSVPAPSVESSTDIEKLIKEKAGIRLDIGGGSNPNAGFINIDILPLPQVDIVWDIEETPWPLPDECVLTAVCSHVLEHINPHKGTFIRVMDEIWRVMKPYGQFAFVVPHGESPGYIQDPTHCNPMNETTMHYFDPDPENSSMGPALYNFYHPKPWKIIKQFFNYTGNLEVLLEKRPMDKTYMGDYPPEDITKEARK